MIKFHKTVLNKKYKKQVVQTVVAPAPIQDKLDQAKAWLEQRDIHDMKGLYGAPI